MNPEIQQLGIDRAPFVSLYGWGYPQFYVSTEPVGPIKEELAETKAKLAKSRSRHRKASNHIAGLIRANEDRLEQYEQQVRLRKAAENRAKVLQEKLDVAHANLRQCGSDLEQARLLQGASESKLFHALQASNSKDLEIALLKGQVSLLEYDLRKERTRNRISADDAEQQRKQDDYTASLVQQVTDLKAKNKSLQKERDQKAEALESYRTNNIDLLGKLYKIAHVVGLHHDYTWDDVIQNVKDLKKRNQLLTSAEMEHLRQNDILALDLKQATGLVGTLRQGHDFKDEVIKDLKVRNARQKQAIEAIGAEFDTTVIENIIASIRSYKKKAEAFDPCEWKLYWAKDLLNNISQAVCGQPLGEGRDLLASVKSTVADLEQANLDNADLRERYDSLSKEVRKRLMDFHGGMSGITLSDTKFYHSEATLKDWFHGFGKAFGVKSMQDWEDLAIQARQEQGLTRSDPWYVTAL
jgi:uncharacterized protein YjbI with pentapeptide repeats